AVDVVQKPTALATDKVFEIGEELVATVKAVAAARVAAPTGSAPQPVPAGPAARVAKTGVLVVGVSTGGPQALKRIIPRLPADFPVPVAMVLHMPIGYTELFARSLAEVSRLSVSEAREGDLLRPGVVLLAPAGYHLLLDRG